MQRSKRTRPANLYGTRLSNTFWQVLVQYQTSMFFAQNEQAIILQQLFRTRPYTFHRCRELPIIAFRILLSCRNNAFQSLRRLSGCERN